jgi:hypothetical protein
LDMSKLLQFIDDILKTYYTTYWCLHEDRLVIMEMTSAATKVEP